MKILYIHQYVFGPTEPGFTRPLEVLGHLVKAGHEAKIISGFYSHITRRRVSKYAASMFRVEKIYGVDVYRVPGLFRLISPFRKLIHHLVFMVTSMTAGLLIGKCDVVIASSPPPFAAVGGWLLSRAKKVPLVLEIRDLWPEDLVQEGLLKQGIWSRSMENTMKALYRRSKLIIAVTEGIKNGICRRGVPAKKIAIIPNSVNADLDNALCNASDMREHLGLRDRFVVTYAGNHGKSNALETLVKSAALLRDISDIKFLFVGDGEHKRDLINFAESLDLTNIVFLTAQPKCRMPEIFCASDVTVVPLKRVPVYDGALPNKLLDSMANGKPVILAAGTEARTVVLAANAGVIADPEDAESIADRVRFLYEHRDLSKRMGECGRKYVIEHYSHQRIANELEKRLLHVVDQAS